VLDPELNLAPISAMPSAEIELVNGAGHMLLHVAPRAVTKAIRAMDAMTAEYPRMAKAC
jgi:hypothetical protein